MLAGHSQGGQSVLWAASLAPSLHARLKVRGTVALAPVSHLAEQSPADHGAAVAERADRPGGDDRARRRHRPPVGRVSPWCMLGYCAALRCTRRRSPRASVSCSTSPSSFGGLAPADLFPPGRRSESARERAGQARPPRGPEDPHAGADPQQGTADQTVFKLFTDPLGPTQNKKRGIKVTYKTYEGVTHGGAVTDARSAADATKYIRARFR